MSLISALSLWFVGALVFFYAEAPQGWSYFTALYFAFTSLVTIGYGDLQPTSNAGKPFFVLWTLLAVPTLTIFISHMGDTAIKAFADLTIWAGTLTVLPGESGFQENLKAATRRVTQGARINPSELRTDKPPGFISHSDETKSQGSGYHADEIEQHGLDRLAKHVEDEELEEAQEADKRGDPKERDLHLYHYVLVRELKTVMQDMHAKPPKQYSYRDWAWFLKLIEQDEGDPDLHRPPPIKPEHAKDTELGKGGNGEERLQWSWLGVRSPLMGAQTEAEWLAERLGEKLETSLKNIRRGDVKDRVPISINDLKKRKKEDAAKVDGKGAPENGEGKDLEKRD
jgi:potassium channel subfamily K